MKRENKHRDGVFEDIISEKKEAKSIFEHLKILGVVILSEKRRENSSQEFKSVIEIVPRKRNYLK